MSVQRHPAVLLSPSYPTPLSPPLPLSPLDIPMLSSRLDFIYIYDKRTASTTAAATTHNSRSTPTHSATFSASRSSASTSTSTSSSFSSSSRTSPLFGSPSSSSSSSPRHHHQPSTDSPFLSSSHLQLALRDTLSDYHVLAGRLTINSYAQQCIRLTDDGVAWIDAVAPPALTVDSLLPAAPQRDDCWAHMRDEDALITPLPAHPSTNTPLLQIQHTQLGCGGVALGVSVYAGVMDAKALFVFMNCWAQASRGRQHTRPSHERHMLANMRVAADINHTHSEYLIVADNSRRIHNPLTATIPSFPAAAANSSLHRSSSTGTAPIDMTLPHTAAGGRRSEMCMCTFHFSKAEIERMKRAATGVYISPSTSTSNTTSPVLSPSAVSSPSLPPLMLRGASNPLSPPGSTPVSPSGSAMEIGSGGGMVGGSSLSRLTVHDPGYVSSFDCLAAHVWQCVMRARFPQLVSALPSPPPPPLPTVLGVVSPTRSLPSTPTHRRPGTGSSGLDRSLLQQSLSFSSPSSPAPLLLFPSSPLPSSYNQPTSPPLAFPSHLAIAFNGRNRLSPPLPDVYCGNVTFLTLVTMALPELLTSPLPTLCSAVHTRMSAMQDDYLRSAITVLSNPPPPAYKLIPSFDTRAGAADVLVSSFLSCDVYRAADFGGGRPAYVGIGGGGERGRWEGCAVLIGGGGGGRDGVDVSVVLREDEMRRLCADERLRCWRLPDGMGGLMEGMEHLELTAAAAQVRATSATVNAADDRYMEGVTVAR